jgi:ferredoxin--NADP+ reductase
MPASETPLRAAIVGAGPAGFYAAEQLLAKDWEVDLFDALPTPFGLVRSGVAPDHPKIKSVTRVYEKTAQRPGFRFFGSVRLGEDITAGELRERYHAVVYAVGTANDNRLGIPGEDTPGSHAATEFVAWYNGHPDYADHSFDLDCERAVVIGNGNVAIDVGRMLMLDADELEPTDTADHAVDALAEARVKDVLLLGRRGPVQAAFTNPELLELGELKRADVIVDPGQLELDPASRAWLDSDAASKADHKRMEILREFAARERTDKTHSIELRFFASPVEVLEGADGRVEGLRVAENRLEEGPDGRLRAVPTGREEVIPCGLVLRSIGYTGRPLPDVPFDERRGLIRNEGGRVVEEDGAPRRGEYCVGWIKRGPSGVIGTNKKDAADTVAKILADAESGALAEAPLADGEATHEWLHETVPGLVDWDGWTLIDEHEKGRGEPSGRPRVKLVRLDEMLDLVSGARSRG